MTLEQFEKLAKAFSPPLTFEKVNTGHAFRRVRFGSPTFEDHLFQYRPWDQYEHFENLANRAAAALERDAERFYSAANNALERTVRHRGPRLAAARSLWPAAQLGR